MKQRQIETSFDVNNVITTTNSDAYDLKNVEHLSIQCVVDVNTPSASEFETSDVTAAADTITEAAHGFTTGVKGQCTTTTTLPAGLSTSTDYFVIVIDDDTYQLASSLSNALAGTQIDITDQGTGTHTFTPTSLAGATVVLQKSNDGTNFDSIGSATSITADGNIWLSATDVNYRYARVQYTLTAGRLSSTNYILGKG